MGDGDIDGAADLQARALGRVDGGDNGFAVQRRVGGGRLTDSSYKRRRPCSKTVKP